MKILYFFQELPTPMFQWQRIHIFDELSHHGCDISVVNPLEYESPEQANEALLHTLTSMKYDLFFTNVCYYKVLFVDTVERIKQLGVPTLCIRCDNLIIPYVDKVLAPHFDLVWLTSVETKHLYDKWGCRSFFAPYAANPYKFVYQQGTLIKKTCFIGTPYGSRSIMMNYLADKMVSVDLFYGKNPALRESANHTERTCLKSTIIMPNRWEEYYNRLKFKEGRKLLWGAIVNKIKRQESIKSSPYLTQHPSVSFEAMSRWYADYVLALSSTSTNHTDALKHPLPVINLRNFEIPMSGGIEICKYNEELAGYFEADKEIVFYHTNDELVEKAKFYTQRASDSLILKMKQAARKRAELDHTWWNRFSYAFQLLGII